MRLRTIANTIKDALPGLACEVVAVNLPNGTNGAEIRTHHRIFKSLTSLMEVEVLRQVVEQTRSSPLFQLSLALPALSATRPDIQQLAIQIDAVRERATVLLAALEGVLGPEQANSIAICLPTGSEPAAVELVADLSDLVGALQNPIARLFNGEQLRVTTAEPGSAVLVLAGVSAGIVTFVVGMVKLAKLMVADDLKAEQTKQSLAGLEDMQKVLAHLAKAAGEAHEKAVAELVHRTNPELDEGERREAVNLTVASTRILAEQFRRNAELQLSWSAHERKDLETTTREIKALLDVAAPIAQLLGKGGV